MRRKPKFITKFSELRPVYESVSTAAWFAGSLISALFGYFGNFGFRFLLLASIPMFLFGLFRLYQTMKRHFRKLDWQYLPDYTMTVKELYLKTKDLKDEYYVGEGAKLTNEDTQKFMDYRQAPESFTSPPKLYFAIRRAFGKAPFRNNKVTGTPHLLAMAERRGDITDTLESRKRHISITGTTGSGKGVNITKDIVQAIFRNEPVCMIDPKLDPNIMNAAYEAHVLMGRENLFFLFDPSNPHCSSRLDVFANIVDEADVTSRITQLCPESSDGAFKAFVWESIHRIVMSMSVLNERYSFKNIFSYLNAPYSRLYVKVAIDYFRRTPGFKLYADQLAGMDDKDKATAIALKVYGEQSRDKYPDSLMEIWEGAFSENREWAVKLVKNIKPALTMLTNGSLGELLNPEYGDADPRPILTLKQISRIGGTLYMNTASLQNSEVSTMIATTMLNNVKSVVSDRFNFAVDGLDDAPLNIYIDESSEAMTNAVVTLLNKSRAANVCLILAQQTANDWIMKLGSDVSSDVAEGSINSMIFFRTSNKFTREKLQDLTPKVNVSQYTQASSTQSKTMSDSQDFNTGYAKTESLVERNIIHADDAPELYNLHGFYIKADASAYIFRTPLVIPNMKFVPKPYDKESPSFLPSVQQISSRPTIADIDFLSPKGDPSAV